MDTRNFNEQHPKIELVTGISRWTSANRNHAVHIANENNKPLCKRSYFTTEFFYGDARTVTCQKCIKIANNHE